MSSPFGLPDDHWLLAQSKEDRVKKMISTGYEMRMITLICKVEKCYVVEIAEKYNITIRSPRWGGGDHLDARPSALGTHERQYQK